MEEPPSRESPPEPVLATAAIAGPALGTAAALLPDPLPTQSAAKGWRKRRWHRRCLRLRRPWQAVFREFGLCVGRLLPWFHTRCGHLAFEPGSVLLLGGTRGWFDHLSRGFAGRSSLDHL